MSTSNYTLKVNIRAQEERVRRERDKAVRESLVKVTSSGPVQRVRKKRGLQFNEPGKYVSEGDRLRKKARLEALQKRIASSAAKTGISDAVKLASLTNKTTKPISLITGGKLEEVDEDIPEIEWWDRALLRNRPLGEAILRLDQNADPEEIFDGLTNLIEHPPIKRRYNADQVKPMPIYLTKAERKKLRRQNRRKAELEKQEMIKLGLLPKPEPKLKKSNLMHTLGQEAIVNPSKVEQMVKEQEEKRQQAHIDHNTAKKLTPDERKAKKLRKISEDLSVEGTWVSVYRVTNLSCPSHKFKISQNAKQLTMTGLLLLYKDLNVVVVEGGPKQQRKYKHLMLDRIKWDEDPLVSGSSNEKSNTLKDNKCSLLWEGQVPGRSFRVFKVKSMQNGEEARNFLKKFKVEHYWDLAFKMNILGTITE